MGEYLLGLAGIVVSVGLFLLGYRQTVGAKRERVNAANTEVEKILVRRIVLESYVPTRDEISRLLSGKARDFRVRASDLISEAQALTTIFTRIVESDLIPSAQRDEILKRITPAMAEAEREPVEEAEVLELSSARQRLMTSTVALTALGLLTSVLGSMVSVLPEIRTFAARLGELLPIVATTAAASFTVIGVMIFIYRLRASQEETSKGGGFARYVEFEREVAKVLKGAGDLIRPTAARDEGFDFLLSRGGRKVLIEVKGWSMPVPVQVLRQVVDHIRVVAQRVGATEAIVVTPTPVRVPDGALESGMVKVMTLRELRNYLAHPSAA